MTGNLYQRLERKFGDAFAAYGRFVYRHAYFILISSIMVNAALSVGMIKFKWNKDAKRLYLPQGTQTHKDKRLLDDIFPDLSGTSFNSLQMTSEGLWVRLIVKAKYGNLLNKTILQEIALLSDSILKITAENIDGSVIKFSDICAISNSKCWVGGELFWNEEFLLALEHKNVTYPVFSTSFGLHQYSFHIGGNISTDLSGKYLRGIEYMKIEYMIRTDEDLFTELGEIWIDKFSEVISAYESQYFDYAYGHFDSLNVELDKTVAGDISLFAVTLVAMIVYACIATIPSRLSLIGHKIWLGLAGTLAAGLAIVSSFGLCSAAGVEFVSIVGMAPFLVIGIGIDDMFILMAGLSSAQGKPSIEDKVSDMLRTSGIGITITTLTDLIAFIAGAGSSLVGVRNFCIYIGIALAFCYINNVTFFTACIVINEQRLVNKRHEDMIRRDDALFSDYIYDTKLMEPKQKEEGYSLNLIGKFVEWVVPKLVLNFASKILIIVFFLGYIAASIYGCIYMKQGVLFTQLVNEDSYFFKFLDWNERFFPRQTIVSLVVTDVLDYSKPETYDRVNNILQNVQLSVYFDRHFEVNWLKSYYASVYFNCSSESAFVNGLRNFLTDRHYAMFRNDVIIDSAVSITASRFYVLSNDLADSQEEGNMMLDVRDIIKPASISLVAYSPLFVYYEQYVQILGLTLKSVGIASVAVFFITCMFMPNLVVICLVTFVVMSIMLGIFGFMLYLDIALSGITMIELLMTVGFSIDFSAHICHGYLISSKDTRQERIKETLKRSGTPILHGAVSSLLGVVIMVSAHSYVFRAFTSVMFLVLFFGITQALFLLPVLLSWIGPKKRVVFREKVKERIKYHVPHCVEQCLACNVTNLSLARNVEETINNPIIKETIL